MLDNRSMEGLAQGGAVSGSVPQQPAGLFARFLRPHPQLEGDARRQAQLSLNLSAVGFGLMFIFGIYETYNQFYIEAETEPDVLVLSMGLAPLLLLSNLLSHLYHYQWGTLVFVFAPEATILTAIIVGRNGDLNNFYQYYLLISVVLASLMLSVRHTWGLALFNVLVLLAASILIDQAQWGLMAVKDAMIFSITVPILLIVSANVRQNSTRILEEQFKALQASQAAEKEARQQAERSSQVKSAFLASMSHELRTPLNSIINFSKFLERGIFGPVSTEQRDTLQDIIESSEHLLNLINDVLDMSKIESGSLQLFIEEQIDLRPIFASVEHHARALLADKAVTYEQSIAADLPLIAADRQRVLQILLNIVSNACKFTTKGSITLSAKHEAENILIAVADSGPGISPKDADSVFTSFRQTSTGLRKTGGTGLGMPISRSLAEEHGGALWFESQPGHGSTFYVRLPIHAQASLKSTPAKPLGA